MSDDEDRQRLATLQAKLTQLSALYDRFGDERFARSIQDLQNQIAALPEHIRLEEKVNQKLAEFEQTVRAYITRRQQKKLPPSADIWETIKGFEKHHDSNDLGNSSLLKTILAEARKLNIADQTLAQRAYETEQSI